MPELIHRIFTYAILVPVFFFISLSTITAQHWPKQINYFNIEINEQLALPGLNNTLADSQQIIPHGLKIQNYYFNSGYLACSIDSLSISANSIEYRISPGIKYHIDDIILDSTLKALKPKTFVYKNQVASYNKLHEIDAELLLLAKNNGYANAQIKRETVLKNNKLALQYKLSNAQKYSIDSISFRQDPLLKQKILYRVSGIYPQSKYQQNLINEIKNKINTTGILKIDSVFVSLNEAFTTNIKIEATKSKSNLFSGYVGIGTDAVTNKTVITGNILLNLINAFKVADEIYFNWNRTGEQSQLLHANIALPYLWGSPVGVFGNINLEKQDSTFNSNKYKLGLSFTLNSYSKLSSFAQTHTSFGIGNNSALPNVNSTYYGLSYTFNNTPKTFNPKKGIDFLIEAGAGNRIQNISDNETESIIFNGSLYFKAINPLPFGNLHLALNSHITLNDSVSAGELNRYGGINNMRGFKERSIFAKQANWLNIEYHLPFNTNSNFLLFYETGVFNESNANNFENLWRQSFGAGLNLHTKSGVLSLIYGLGSTGNNSLNLKNGLVHIGYSNTF